MITGLAFGVAIICLTFLVLIAILDDKHMILKLFFLLSIFTILIFVPKSFIDDECYPVVHNATLQGNTTTYTYKQECISTSTSSTAVDFFDQYTWIYRIIWVYVFIYIFYEIFSRKDLILSKVRKWRK